MTVEQDAVIVAALLIENGADVHVTTDVCTAMTAIYVHYVLYEAFLFYNSILSNLI